MTVSRPGVWFEFDAQRAAWLAAVRSGDKYLRAEPERHIQPAAATAAELVEPDMDEPPPGRRRCLP
jgi:hypothetical protein